MDSISGAMIYENVIVGGGPGGINLAIEFRKLGISFLLVERQSRFGGQFWAFPKCGELISLNKKHLPYGHPGFDYARRYDWHTLSSITQEDSEEDSKLLFTNWTDRLFPSSTDYAKYIDYLGCHSKWNIKSSTKFDTEVVKISRKEGRFIVEIKNKDGFRENIPTERLFLATGTSCPVIPKIDGIEYGTCYTEFDPNDKKRYQNRSVVVIGSGNSAFEIAHSLRETVGTLLMLTRSSYRFARQTHNVHDVRSQTSVVYDLAQLKSLVTLSAEHITKIEKLENGQLRLITSTPEPHWVPPRRRNRSLDVDYVIYCTGFVYTLPNVFAEDLQPDIDKDNKFCILTNTWESVNIKNLYFIGGSMRSNDKFAASGFVHGFRYNVKALAHLIAEKHYSIQLQPIYECEVDPEKDGGFDQISQFMVKYVSSTASLFELFEYGCCAITIEKVGGRYYTKVWETLPKQYVHERWGRDMSLIGRVEVIFQYGFDQYGNDIPSHHFTHPADHFRPELSAYIHPVFHCYRHTSLEAASIQVDEFHMQESLLARWDKEDYTDPETNSDQYLNVVYNAIASVFTINKRRSMLPVHDQYIDDLYPLMTEEETEKSFKSEPGLLWIKNARRNPEEIKIASTLSLGIQLDSQ